MSKEKQTQDALLEAIDIAVENKLKKLGFNYYVDGVIKGKNTDNTYNVLINGEIYNNVPSKNNFEYSVNDVVQVLIKNGNWNKKFIDDKKQHNKSPQNILNIEENVSNIEQDISNIETNITNISNNLSTAQNDISTAQTDITNISNNLSTAQNDISNIKQNYLNIGKRTRIEANKDFNDYTNVGSYAVYTDSDAKTISNIPKTSSGILNVYSSNGNDISSNQYKYLVQEYTTLTGNYKFIRHIRQTPDILADTTKYPKGWEFNDWEIDVNSYTLINNTTIKNALLNLVYPIGNIYITSTNNNPSTFLGGTWKLVNKEFSSLVKGSERDGVLFTIGKNSDNQNNATTCGVAISRQGHLVYTRFVITNAVILNDSSVTIGSVNLNAIGVTNLEYTKYAVGYSDGGNAIFMAQLNDTGSLIINDVISRNTDTKTIASGNKCMVEFVHNINMDKMLDSACDKFYWKRTK